MSMKNPPHVGRVIWSGVLEPLGLSVTKGAEILGVRRATLSDLINGKAALTAEECFHQALAIARHQQAKSLELRAAMSLSRLWQQQGKRQEAHDLLVPIYNWFTEGFDTADLHEAKALLEALA